MKIETNPPAPFADKSFPWQMIRGDDFICIIGAYTLRVEWMDRGHWWWRVSYNGEPIVTKRNEFSNSKYRAIGLAEGLYMGHKASNYEKH